MLKTGIMPKVIINSSMILLMFTYFVDANTVCDRKECVEIPKHYEELGCTPITEKGKCCPTRFECPDRSIDNAKCLYKGKSFNRDDSLPEDQHSKCVASCHCGVSYPDENVSIWNCANVECPEDLGGAPENNCVNIAKLDQCCGESVCDPKEIEELSKVKCEFNGQEYTKGQHIDPGNCYECICNEDFDNSTVEGNKNCQKIDCGFELHYSDRIHEGCIPIYYKSSTCCPIDWRCPENNDEIIPKQRSEHPTDDSDNMICKFGNLTLNWRDELKTAKDCVTCECLVPPMAHCIQTC